MFRAGSRDLPRWYAMGRWNARAPGNWSDSANCKNQRMWYSTFSVEYNPILTPEDQQMETEALDLCRGCPVLLECRRWALTDPDPATDMVAGGLTPHQRMAKRLR